MNHLDYLYVVSIIFWLLLLLLIVFLVVNKIRMFRVRKHSCLIVELNKLNSSYNGKFKSLLHVYHIENECNSLQKYRNNCRDETILNFMMVLVRNDENKWHNIYDKVIYNQKLFAEYKVFLAELKSKYWGATYNENPNRFPLMSKRGYLKIENRLFEEVQLKPVLCLKVVLRVFYISPAGRNRYISDFSLDEHYIKMLFDKIKEREYYEQSVKYQRQLMTNSKRYEILKRDGFKCQICGRSKDEGAVLEVDHIIPVSKGGKTINSNLRTLCRECNQGKKDKLE